LKALVIALALHVIYARTGVTIGELVENNECTGKLYLKGFGNIDMLIKVRTITGKEIELHRQ
jgi:hypothetical protein